MRGEPSVPTTHTSDTAARASAGRLKQLVIAPTGAVTPTVIVYDNPSAASGTKLCTVKTLSAAPITIGFGEDGVDAATGIFVTADSWTTLTVTCYSTGV